MKRGQRSGRALWGGLAAGALAVAVSGAVLSGRASRRPLHEVSTPSARALATTSSAPATTSSALATTSSARTIAGFVRDRNGAPITGAEVGSADWALGRAKTDAEGRFELSGVSGDAVALYALAAGFAPARLERVPAGSVDVVLVVSPPSRISGALRLPVGTDRVLVSLCRSNVATGGELCVARRLYSPAAERYELERLAAGEYTIVAEVTGRRPTPTTPLSSVRRPATTMEPSPGFPTLRLAVTIPAAASIEGPLLAWP